MLTTWAWIEDTVSTLGTWDLNKTTVTKRKETEETSSSFYNQCSMYDPVVNVQRSPCSPRKPILPFGHFDLTAQISTCMYLFFFFASFNNHAFHCKTLVLWEVTSFPRSLADKNFVTGFKSFSLVKPLVASYHSIVKFCAVKINFSPYVLNAPPLSDQFSFMLVTSSPFESKHTSDAFTSTLDLRP